MSVSRLALLLCLMLPVPGLAQDSTAPEEPVPSLSPPPLIPAPPRDSTEDSPADAPRDELIPREWDAESTPTPTVLRLFLEFFGGAAGASVGVIPGGVLVLSSICFDGCDDGSATRGIVGVAIGLVGLAGGTALGVVGGAYLADGEGRYWPTAAGAGLGTLVGATLGLVLASNIDEEELALIAPIASPIIGGMIGYEISHSDAVERRHRSSSSDTRILPLISTLPGGGLLGGVVGRF